jgi:hypothetical protein
LTPIRVLNLGKEGNWNPFSTIGTSTFGSAEVDARSLHKITLYPSCRSRKSHPREFAPEGELRQHHMRCLPSSICLRCWSPICSNLGGRWKSRTSFFVTSRGPGPFPSISSATPIPHALETDWPVGAAGFEPVHIRSKICQDSQPGGGTRGALDRRLDPVEA